MTNEDLLKLVETSDYDFLRTNRVLKNNLLFLTLGGSHAYGTNNENSDVDVRGVFGNTREMLHGFTNCEQVVDNNTDTCIYNVSKFFTLILDCNPNTIELLGCNPEHYLMVSRAGKLLLDNKKLFLSQRAIKSFGGYAYAQLNRLLNAQGRNSENSIEQEESMLRSMKAGMQSYNTRYAKFDDCNIKLYIDSSNKTDLEKEIFCDIKLTHYPLRDLNGILNENNNILKQYAKVNHRNNKKDIPHLCKHAMHLIRLYMMGFDLLENEEINTYRTGKDHKLLMDIRNGKYLDEDNNFNQEFKELLTHYQNRFEYASKNTCLPIHPDMKKTEELLIQINEWSLVYGN